MDNEKLNQALKLIKEGDKTGAEEILLECLKVDPGNSDVYYALAICSQTDVQRIDRLEKSLLLNPNNKKAEIALKKYLEKTTSEQPPESKIATNEMRESFQDKSVLYKSKFDVETRIKFVSSWIFLGAFVLLLITVIWQFTQIIQIEKYIEVRSKDIQNIYDDSSYMLKEILTNKSNIQLLMSDNEIIKSDILLLSSNNDTLMSNIMKLAAGLDYVTPLAENANRYAHSHSTYSDIRLKTNIVEINGPMEKLSQIQAVYFYWDLENYPDMNLDDQKQIGIIAQDIENVFPELVSEDQNGFKQVDYEKLSVLLLEAIKDQQREIEKIKIILDMNE